MVSQIRDASRELLKPIISLTLWQCMSWKSGYTWVDPECRQGSQTQALMDWFRKGGEAGRRYTMKICRRRRI